MAHHGPVLEHEAPRDAAAQAGTLGQHFFLVNTRNMPHRLSIFVKSSSPMLHCIDVPCLGLHLPPESFGQVPHHDIAIRLWRPPYDKQAEMQCVR